MDLEQSSSDIGVIEYPDGMGKGLSFQTPEGGDGELMVMDNLAVFEFPVDTRDREVTILQGEISFRIPSGPNRQLMEASVLDRRVPSPNDAHILKEGGTFVVPAGVSNAEMISSAHYPSGNILLKCVYRNPVQSDKGEAIDGEQEGIDTERVGAALKGAAMSEQ